MKIRVKNELREKKRKGGGLREKKGKRGLREKGQTRLVICASF